MNIQTVKFTSSKDADFVKTVRKRVNKYFKDNGISRYANANMVVKTVFMFCLYFTPYFSLLFGNTEGSWLFWFCWVVMGFGMAGIGLSVMHDANHGAYSKNTKINNIIGRVMYLVGGSADNWKMQHNILHHTYTNIDGLDEDIDSPWFLRFSPHQDRRKIHRFQHRYAWFFYGFMTLAWAITKDFRQADRYCAMGLNKQIGRSKKSLFSELIVWKVVYASYIVAIPMLVVDAPWWQILLGFFIMHYIAGFVLAIIFQPAHVMEETEFPLPTEANTVENNLLVHQLLTTTNFAPNAKLFNWYVGGLNYQIEHHLFPNICHVHYKKISKIVQETAAEFGLPYMVQPTFARALVKHGRMLKTMGREG